MIRHAKRGIVVQEGIIKEVSAQNDLKEGDRR
jgi:hypothetical protein